MQVIAVIGFLIFIKNREIFIFSICFCIGFTILAVGEMPIHNHSASTNTTGDHAHQVYGRPYENNDWEGIASAQGDVKTSPWTSTNGTHNHTVSVGNAGSSQSHNNMPPYLSVYIWKRVV